jgi:hypothetical protein
METPFSRAQSRILNAVPGRHKQGVIWLAETGLINQLEGATQETWVQNNHAMPRVLCLFDHIDS